MCTKFDIYVFYYKYHLNPVHLLSSDRVCVRDDTDDMLAIKTKVNILTLFPILLIKNNMNGTQYRFDCAWKQYTVYIDDNK